MKEVQSRSVQHIRKMRCIRRWIFLSLLLFTLCITGIICSHIIAEATVKKESVPVPYKYYTEVRVFRDDTLWTIADRYMSVGYDSIEEYIQEICEVNSISHHKIYYGQQLIVPYYSYEFK